MKKSRQALEQNQKFHILSFVYIIFTSFQRYHYCLWLKKTAYKLENSVKRLHFRRTWIPTKLIFCSWNSWVGRGRNGQRDSRLDHKKKGYWKDVHCVIDALFLFLIKRRSPLRIIWLCWSKKWQISKYNWTYVYNVHLCKHTGWLKKWQLSYFSRKIQNMNSYIL